MLLSWDCLLKLIPATLKYTGWEADEQWPLPESQHAEAFAETLPVFNSRQGESYSVLQQLTYDQLYCIRKEEPFFSFPTEATKTFPYWLQPFNHRHPERDRPVADSGLTMLLIVTQIKSNY